jgi:2-hydroxy-3-keto-5-methylthiopentenyl-1-phosphate phosphatase
MLVKTKSYKAIVSSDWNECLAPCGPFDFISFNYPQLAAQLETIFKEYTGKVISLGEAVGQIQKLLPAPITEKQMDNYLNDSFSTYKGVPELIEWCLSNNILIMINTTGMIGYFQRIFAKNLLPKVPLLSAHPMVRYPKNDAYPRHIYDLFETIDKGKNTESVIRSFNVPSNKVIIMGDSGGDGPHFEWGAANNAFLIANMTKPSLKRYCEQKSIMINAQFGPSYAEGEVKDMRKEMRVNFMDLAPIIHDFINS